MNSRPPSMASAAGPAIPLARMPVRASARAAKESQVSGSRVGLGVAALCVFLFLSYSRVADVLLAPLHIPLITSLLALAIVVFRGELPRTLRSRIGLWLCAFCTWIFVATPFSFWRGGSVQLLRDHWIKSFLVFVIIAGLLKTGQDCRRALYSLGAAVVAIVFMALAFGARSLEGRLVLGAGVLANPNDLAQLLLICLPFLLLMYLTQGSSLRRFVALCCIPAVLMVVAQTGSRGGIVTLGVLIAAIFLTSRWSSRIKLATVLVLAVMLVLPFVGAQQRARFATLFGDDGEAPERAVSSTEARKDLLKQSLTLTFRNPIFGVGPGMFEPASAKLSEERGERAMWHETHNTYTQVSSELGLPGFFLYFGTLVMCLRSMRSVYKQTRYRDDLADLANMSYCLWLSMLGFSVSTLFSSVAYHLYLPTFVGLSAALSGVAAASGTEKPGLAAGRPRPLSAVRPRPPLPV